MISFILMLFGCYFNFICMKILVVSQYFPPYNTPRAFRTFELAKEFARVGHDVTVYSLIGKVDNSEIEKKYNLKIRDYGPSRFGNADSSGYWNKNILYRICAHLFVRYEFPSFELTYLIKKKIKNIEDYDMVVSVAWPFWIHFGIGLLKRNSKNFPVWVSDCGDPFTGNPFIKYPQFFKKIEKWWGQLTDFITVPISQAKDAYLPEFQNKIRVIPQGFDFTSTNISEYKKNKIPTFVYAGSFYEGVRDPRKLLEYLSTLNSEFLFKIYTNEPQAIADYASKLGHKVIVNNYIKREDLLIELSSADFLVNIKNIGTVQSPSKLIDYTLAMRPIITVTSNFGEQEQKVMNEFLNSDYTHQDEKINISDYDIKNVANKLLKLYQER